jgi:hypothetical protein
LAIARSYARLMGGDITVTSTLGAGSTFRFELPLTPDDLKIDQEPRSMINTTWLGMETAAIAPAALNLMELPVELIHQLHDAVQQGEKDRLDELIRRAGDLDKRAGAALEQLANNYEYDTLTSLLKDARREILP